MTAPNPILYYDQDAYDVARVDLKGRHAAGEGFLSAFLAQSAATDVYALPVEPSHFASFANAVERAGRNLTPRQVRRENTNLLRERGIVVLSDPNLPNEARIRSWMGDDGYAICGITHTVSSKTALYGLADYAAAPIMPWDALICTSRAAHAAVDTIIQAGEDELRRRLGATRFIRPLMPVIPLGIHTERFTRNDKRRHEWRQRLGLSDDTVAILFFGRLSAHAKASPFQLAQGAELAARQQNKPLAIIWAGRFYNDYQRRTFLTTAKEMAPSVPFHHVDGGDPEVGGVWSAADIFCSLSDNIQESFGLTVVEAMAAELPVVATNWDGYRDTVEDGVTGILIDTAMPEHSFSDAAYQYIGGAVSYDLFIGGLSQICVVNLEQLSRSLVRLAQDAQLRRNLGIAARHAALSRFDWSVVMRRYRELWAEQYAQLVRARNERNSEGMKPSRPFDPAKIFAGHASHRVPATMLLARGPYYEKWDDFIGMTGVIVTGRFLVESRYFDTLKEAFQNDVPASITEVLARFPPALRYRALRTVYWAVKVGLLRFCSSEWPAKQR